MANQPHVVILGAGFGDIGVLKSLGDADVSVTLIDKHDYCSSGKMFFLLVKNGNFQINFAGSPAKCVQFYPKNPPAPPAERRDFR